MNVVRRGQRSSILRERDYFFRIYHDTGEVVEIPTRLDERGVRRFEHNETMDSLRRPRRLPPYLQRARMCVLAAATIDDVASRCGVKRSTAWNYVTTLCEDADVATHVVSQGFVCPELHDACRDIELEGPLGTVMGRIEKALHGNIVWRCEEDRYSQLRLLRVCLTSLKNNLVSIE